MKTLRILFWANTVLFTTALFIALATGNYGTVVWISLCIFFNIADWCQTKHIDEQEKYLKEWQKLTFEYREISNKVTTELQKAYDNAFRMAMLLGIDNEITE